MQRVTKRAEVATLVSDLKTKNIIRDKETFHTVKRLI